MRAGELAGLGGLGSMMAESRLATATAALAEVARYTSLGEAMVVETSETDERKQRKS